jgi:hypothetical protein
MRYLVPAALIAVTLAGCTAPPRSTPVAQPVAPPRPTPPPPRPTPTPVPLAADWRDWAFTPGDWVYRRDARGSIALFGAVGADAQLTVRCDSAGKMLYLSVHGPANAATIRTTSLTRAISLQPTGGEAGYVASALPTSDSLLDAMAFSRGRFVIDRSGQPPLVVPPYAELGRVIEDCRG